MDHEASGTDSHMQLQALLSDVKKAEYCLLRFASIHPVRGRATGTRPQRTAESPWHRLAASGSSNFDHVTPLMSALFAPPPFPVPFPPLW